MQFAEGGAFWLAAIHKSCDREGKGGGRRGALLADWSIQTRTVGLGQWAWWLVYTATAITHFFHPCFFNTIHTKTDQLLFSMYEHLMMDRTIQKVRKVPCWNYYIDHFMLFFLESFHYGEVLYTHTTGGTSAGIYSFRHSGGWNPNPHSKGFSVVIQRHREIWPYSAQVGTLTIMLLAIAVGFIGICRALEWHVQLGH